MALRESREEEEDQPVKSVLLLLLLLLLLLSLLLLPFPLFLLLLLVSATPLTYLRFVVSRRAVGVVADEEQGEVLGSCCLRDKRA